MSEQKAQKAKEAKDKQRAEAFWRQAAKQGLKDNASRHRASRIHRA